MTVKNIVVISHRRSGTHLTMDSIRNNFRTYKYESRSHKYMTLDFITDHYGDAKIPLEEFRKNVYDSPHIFFTHTSQNFEQFYDNDNERVDFISELFDQSKLIYVHRDGRDVLTSLYYYGKKYMPELEDMSFSDFIRMDNNFDFRSYEGKLNRIEYWNYHVESWIDNKDMLHLGFEDFKNNYEETIKKISNFIELPLPDKIQKMTRKAPPRIIANSKMYRRINFHYNKNFGKKTFKPYYFRKGSSGEHKKHFKEADYLLFNKITSDLMSKLGYNI